MALEIVLSWTIIFADLKDIVIAKLIQRHPILYQSVVGSAV